jgi:hypothetical protein
MNSARNARASSMIAASASGSISKNSLAPLRFELLPARRLHVGWRVGAIAAAGAVGAAVRLRQRRRKLHAARLALEQQGRDALGDGRDQLPPGREGLGELVGERRE